MQVGDVVRSTVELASWDGYPPDDPAVFDGPLLLAGSIGEIVAEMPADGVPDGWAVAMFTVMSGVDYWAPVSESLGMVEVIEP